MCDIATLFIKPLFLYKNINFLLSVAFPYLKNETFSLSDQFYLGMQHSMHELFG